MDKSRIVIATFPQDDRLYDGYSCAASIKAAAEVLQYAAASFDLPTEDYMEIFRAYITPGVLPERPLERDEVQCLLEAAENIDKLVEEYGYEGIDERCQNLYAEEGSICNAWDLAIEVIERMTLPVMQCWDGQPQRIKAVVDEIPVNGEVSTALVILE